MNPVKVEAVDIDVIDAVSSLSIEVRRVVEGFLGGGHASLHPGSSVEFSEHNKYSPGDDLRHLDWKAMARTDRYFIKTREREVVLSCLMVLDCSASMAYVGTRAHKSKFDYCRSLLGAMGYLLLKQGDAVGLLGFASENTGYLPPRQRPDHLSAFMNMLGALQTAPFGTTNFGAALTHTADRLGQRSMVVLASDMWGIDDSAEVALASLSARGHDVVLFHILSPDELDFPFEVPATFAGMEDEGEILVDPSLIRQDYRKAIMAERDRIESFCGRAGIDMYHATINENAASVLGRFAGRRRRTRISR